MARKAPFLERTSRRAAIVSGRSLKTFTGSRPKHRSVFLHMPKCGGTSLSEAMYATVPFYERIGVIDAVATRRAAGIVHFDRDDPWVCHEDLENGQKVFDLREQMLLQHMAWDTMLIHGHVLWSERAAAHFGDLYKFVTLLRDPVERTVSNMRMAQRAGLVGDDPEAYLQSDVARRQA
ncbi:MAG: sulfotransferase family 2 domain-containing protein, partial [Maritimibacter sp.]|nr:sulfotransferase family 2 domain-containing protein [Maritimibacter sp.]